MVYCRNCSKKYFCKDVEKTRWIDCDMYEETLDFLIDNEEEFLMELDRQESAQKKKVKNKIKVKIKVKNKVKRLGTNVYKGLIKSE